MEVQDLKVESASVFVTNANQENAKYRISSNFNTREGVLIRIDNGSVVEVESNEVVASFNMVFEYGKFRALLKQEPDGRITGYSDFLDGLTPIIITLIPQENGDIRLMHPDSADLQLLFVREG